VVRAADRSAGGLRLLDMRFTGYNFEDARTFVTAIGEGSALYLGPQLWLDMVYPPLLGAIFLTYRWLFPGWPGRAIGTVSLASVVVDYLEN
jgi:hypothetical protein